MTPEQRDAIVAALAPYGATLTDDGTIARATGPTGVRLEVRARRLRGGSSVERELARQLPHDVPCSWRARLRDPVLVLERAVNRSAAWPSNL